MSKYSTGEIAKLCNVSNRTIQYYDSKGILHPTELSEGGRRLYTDDDLCKMKIICFLKNCNFSLDNISKILKEDNSKDVINLLLKTEKAELEYELREKREKLNKLNELQNILGSFENFSIDTLQGASLIMENKKKLKKFHYSLLLIALPITILEWVSIFLWIFTGIWWPFVVYTVLAIPFGIFLSKYYFKRVAYICPNCNETFKPKFKEAFFASHTPKTRKLTCPSCSKKSYCVEIYKKD